MAKVTTYSISLVTFNGENDIPLCLRSIGLQTIRPNEYAIIDNNSNDSSVRHILKESVEADITISDHNDGFGRAHNLNIRKSTSDYILILNQDLVLDTNYCEALIHFLNEHPDVGSVTGKILRVAALDSIPANLGIDACGISVSVSLHVSNTHSGKKSDQCKHDHEVFGVPATCALYRRSALEDCAIDKNGIKEYFDEDFFMYKEDVDLAYRLRLRGWKSYCITRAIAYHVRTAKSAYLVMNRGSAPVRYWSYRNHWYVLIKNIPLQLVWRIGFFVVAYELGKFLYLILFERSTLAALIDVKKNYKTMLKKRNNIQLHASANARHLLQWMMIV